jgi:hypothetical protein
LRERPWVEVVEVLGVDRVGRRSQHVHVEPLAVRAGEDEQPALGQERGAGADEVGGPEEVLDRLEAGDHARRGQVVRPQLLDRSLDDGHAAITAVPGQVGRGLDAEHLPERARARHLLAERAEPGPDLDQHVGANAEAVAELEDALDPGADDAIATRRLARREDVLGPVAVVLGGLVVLPQVLGPRSRVGEDGGAFGAADIGQSALLERRLRRRPVAGGAVDADEVGRVPQQPADVGLEPPRLLGHEVVGPDVGLREASPCDQSHRLSFTQPPEASRRQTRGSRNPSATRSNSSSDRST